MSSLPIKITTLLITTLLLGSSLIHVAGDEKTDDGWRSDNTQIESRQL